MKLLLDGQEQEFVVMEEGQVGGILTRKDLIQGLAEYGRESPVANVMRKDYITLHPEVSLPEVYQKLMTNSCSVAPVIEDGELIGIVDKENINELIMVKEALK